MLNDVMTLESATGTHDFNQNFSVDHSHMINKSKQNCCTQLKGNLHILPKVTSSLLFPIKVLCGLCHMVATLYTYFAHLAPYMLSG